MTFDRILTGIVAVGILAAIVVASERHRVLTAGQTVEFTLSLPAARESSVTQAFSLEEIIKRFRSAGVTTLLVRGMTLQTLLDYGGTGFPAGYPVWLAVESDQAGDQQIFIRGNPDLAHWVEQRLISRLGTTRVQRAARSTPEMLDLRIVQMDRSSLLALNLGVHPADLALAANWGLGVTVEFAESLPHLATQIDLPVLLEGLGEGTPILFSGATGLGESALAQAELRVGQHPLVIDHSSPPFSLGLAPGVRTLNLPAVKMLRVVFTHTGDDVVTAVRDRQMRMILLQPFHISGNIDLDLSQQSLAWAQVVRRLQATGFATGRAAAIDPYSPSSWLKVVIGLGVGAAAALLLSPLSWLIRAPLLIAVAAFGLLPTTLVWQSTALLTAAVLPVLGAAYSYRQKRFIPRIGLLVGSALTAGLMITALLGDSVFALELHVFRGVKVALLAPVVLWIAWIGWRERAVLPAGFRLRLWHLGVAAIVIIGLWVMTVRTGHAVEWRLISTIELQIRVVLEQVLGVRPRFKEFVLGWPLLVFAYFAMQNHQLRLSYALTAGGLIGMASMVNSFAHLHTPVLTSLVRGIHGVWIGLLAGFLAAFLLPGLLRPVLQRWRRLSNAA